jgi:hypothetical protein
LLASENFTASFVVGFVYPHCESVEKGKESTCFVSREESGESFSGLVSLENIDEIAANST